MFVSPVDITGYADKHKVLSLSIFAGSLESANSSYSGCAETFQRFGGEKNQDFMIIRCPIS